MVQVIVLALSELTSLVLVRTTTNIFSQSVPFIKGTQQWLYVQHLLVASV